MQNHKTFSELKALARGQMLGKYSTLISALLLENLLILLCSFIAITAIPGADMVSNILYYIVSFIIQLLGGIFNVGVCMLCLNVICNMPYKISDIFYGFKNCPDKAIRAQFFLALLNAVCLLPYNILLWKLPQTPDYLSMSYVSTALFFGTLVFTIISLHFSQIFFLMIDFPDTTVKELYLKSKEIMRGNKWRFFLLQLSFFPLLLLSILSCGIALLWIIPYMEITFANFYLDLMARRNKTILNDNPL